MSLISLHFFPPLYSPVLPWSIGRQLETASPLYARMTPPAHSKLMVLMPTISRRPTTMACKVLSGGDRRSTLTSPQPSSIAIHQRYANTKRGSTQISCVLHCGVSLQKVLAKAHVLGMSLISDRLIHCKISYHNVKSICPYPVWGTIKISY